MAAVRLAIRKALDADPALEEEIRAMLARAGTAAQQIYAGRDAYTAGRDQVVVNYRQPGD